MPVGGDGVHVSIRADDVLHLVELSQAPLDVGHHGPELGGVGLRASRSGSGPPHRPSSGRRRRPPRPPVPTRRRRPPGRPASPWERRPCRSRARPRRTRASRRSPSCGAGRSSGPCVLPGCVRVGRRVPAGAPFPEMRVLMASPLVSPGARDGTPQATSAGALRDGQGMRGRRLAHRTPVTTLRLSGDRLTPERQLVTDWVATARSGGRSTSRAPCRRSTCRSRTRPRS